MNDKKDPNAPNPWMKSLLIWLGVVFWTERRSIAADIGEVTTQVRVATAK